MTANPHYLISAGQVMCFWKDEGQTFCSDSENCGQTWSAPRIASFEELEHLFSHVHASIAS